MKTAVEWLQDCLTEQYPNGSFVWNTKADLEALFNQAKKMENQQCYSEEEVLHLLDTLWDRLDIWYNEKADREFNLIDWFNQCELKKK